MKKKLAIALLGFSMVFGFSTSNFALAQQGPLPGPVTTDTANDNIGPEGQNINANKTGDGIGTNDGTRVGDVIKSDGMNIKFGQDGTKVTGDVTQRTHGEYQNNTNSCASCHQTHTAAAATLLFKSGVYETCTACHDGTLGFYNVYKPSTAGTFGGTAEGNSSIHMATGVMETKAAPGGNRTPSTEMAEEHWGGEFTCASCHSPHGSYSDRLLNFNPNGIAGVPMVDDAKGSYTGTANAPTGGQMVRGQVLATLPVVNPDPALDTSPDYVAYLTTAGDPLVALTGQKYTSGTTTPTLADTDKVIVAMKKSGTSYVRDTAPWINGGEYNHAHTFKVNFTKLFTGAPLDLVNSVDNTQITTGVNYNLQKGFAQVTLDVDGYLLDSAGKQILLNAKAVEIAAYDNTKAYSKDAVVRYNNAAYIALKATTKGIAPDADPTMWGPTTGNPIKVTDTQADLARAYVVKFAFDTTNVKWYGAVGTGVQIKQVDPSTYDASGRGVAISTFCASCHTDYLAKSGSESGVWSKAFRHTTTSDSYTCLKCHFAHGTDVTVMMDAQDRSISKAATDLFAGDTAAATQYLLDKNPDSALKRYTNMSVCWKCHTQSHNVGLTNNDYVNNTKYDTDTTNNLTNGFQKPANNTLPYFNYQTPFGSN